MRSAETIYNEMLTVNGEYTKEIIINAIKSGQIEAIKECAEVAKTMPFQAKIDFETPFPQTFYRGVDKESILSLIEKVK